MLFMIFQAAQATLHLTRSAANKLSTTRLVLYGYAEAEKKS
jgi:hypothetical protein